MFKGSFNAKPNITEEIPKITIGNMYKISLGHAGSPYVLWAMPLDNFWDILVLIR